ncbi:MAG TPA: chromosomal replication initiator protein DnaA [Patescibacteria group bacterium]|nr:chromosomal replication initiator protein DnaA [Patescibacteria group bacterium]
MQCQDLWDRALGEVEVEVSKAVFLTLFKRTSLLSLEENIATVTAPSMMIIDLLQRRFYQNIKVALDKQTGLDIKIVFVPGANPQNIVPENVGPLFSQQEGKLSVGHLPRVRPDFTFDNMAVSGSNQLAFVSATSVAKKMGNFYNPLFLYGPVGVGKTHLMQAIANDIYLKSPNKKILYITSEEFTNEVVEAIRTNSTSAMKRRFRNLDLLLIDDVQFLAGKEKVQEELFHTFNILIDNSSQIVLSSDRMPNEIPKVEKRLLSRFSGGLTVDIDPPDFELRCAIVLIKAKKIGVNVTIDGAKIIAENLTDTRALEGCLLRIATQSEATGEEVNLSFVEKIVNGKKREDEISFGPDEIVESVCSFYKIRPSQIRSAGRSASLVRARQVAMYLLKKELGLSFSEIGGIFGGRDHTTVMHGVEKISGLIEKNKISLDALGIARGQKPRLVDY